VTVPAGGHAQVGSAQGSLKPPIRHRKSIYLLSAPQLKALRDAFAAAEAILNPQDNRGLQYWAGLHGNPGHFCIHGPTPGRISLFLPWHRAYLYFFELALRDHVPDATLAWWDWTTPRAHQNGIPRAFSDATVGQKANPLFAAPVELAKQGNNPPPMTSRDPGDPSELPNPSDVQVVLSIQQYNRFSSQLENIHNGVHGWVGGVMGVIPWAAFDPIFWAHHAMIDRIWSLWQLNHRPLLPDSYLDQALPPFPMTARETTNITTLGYDYASATSHVGVR
jgi:tyrosinase